MGNGDHLRLISIFWPRRLQFYRGSPAPVGPSSTRGCSSASRRVSSWPPVIKQRVSNSNSNKRNTACASYNNMFVFWCLRHVQKLALKTQRSQITFIDKKMQQNCHGFSHMDVPTLLQSILDVVLQLGHGTCHRHIERCFPGFCR